MSLVDETKLKDEGMKGMPFSVHGETTPDRGKWRLQKPVIDHDKCIRCHICWLHCPDAAYSIDKDGYPKDDLNVCKGCGICAEVCPVKCISMVKDEHRGRDNAKNGSCVVNPKGFKDSHPRRSIISKGRASI